MAKTPAGMFAGPVSGWMNAGVLNWAVPNPLVAPFDLVPDPGTHRSYANSRSLSPSPDPVPDSVIQLILFA